MKGKRFISLALAAAMTGACGTAAVNAAEHTPGEHDFGDPIAPYTETKLVLKSQIEQPTTVSHTSKNVSGSPAETTEIIESSAQFYTRDNGDAELADGSLTDRTYGNIKNVMFAYMYEPAQSGTYPAILFLHGGGGTADIMKDKAKDFAAKGYVTMAIDIPSLCGSVPDVEVGGESEKRTHGSYNGGDTGTRFKLTEAEGGAANSDLVDSEIGVIQAFNYLASNTKTDKSNMGIMGSSWGGYSATLVTGILGSKVKAAYSQYGSGFYGPAPDGTAYDSFWTDNGFFPRDEFAAEEWYRYLDPSAHLDNMTANYYMDAAAKDTFYRPRSVEATLDKASNVGNAASTNHVWSYNASHESISGSDTVYPFMDYYLKGRGTRISKTEITKTELLSDGSNKVHISVDAEAEPESVKLVYSKNDTGYTARRWETLNAQKENGEYTAVIPAQTVAAGVEYYALTKDGDKLAYSSSRMKTGFTQKVTVASTPTFKLNDTSSNVIGKGEFTAVVPVVNNDYAEPSSVRVILALYKNGALEKTVLSDTASLAAGESRDIPVTMNIDAEDIAPYSVKLMIWDGINTMTPYDKEYSLAAIDTAPSAPGKLTITGSTIDGISMAWEPSADNIAVEGYEIYRKAAASGDYEKLASLEGNALTYTDDMIEVNETYDYQIRAFDGSGNRSDAAEIRAKAVEGAKVVLNSYDPETGTDISGYKMSAHIAKDNGNGTTVEYMPGFKPLQDENTMDCLEIKNSTQSGTGKYIELKVDDDYITAGLDSRVAVMVTFNDINFDKVKMQYNSADGNSYKDAVIYSKLNEQRWMTKTYIIDDASFANAQSGGYDLRINFDLGTTNDIAMIQIVNLSEDLSAVSSGVDSIGLTWKQVTGARYYELYRDGELIAEPSADMRSYTDEGLVIDTEYTYTLKAVTETETREIKTITASTIKSCLAEADFNAGTEENMRAAATGFTEENVDGLNAVVTEGNTNSLKLMIDNTVIPDRKDYLVTFKYNDLGVASNMRVGISGSKIDGAHYFYTNGTNRWETATVLVPDYKFNNNAEDIQLRATNPDAKFAVADVRLSECPSYKEGAKYINGIVSGVTTADGLLNTSMTTFKRSNDKSSAEVIELDGENVIRINSTDVNGDGYKRAEFNLVPDYRLLGQNYKNSVLPDEEGYDERPAQVRPITVKVTYLKNNSGGAIYIKGAKYDTAENKVTNPDNDGVMELKGSGEWTTAKINIDDYFYQGGAVSLTSPIKLIVSGVPQDEDIIIGKIEIMNRDYSTKIGECSAENADNAEGLTAVPDDGVIVDAIDGKAAFYTDMKGENISFAVDESAAQGNRYLVITYNDCGRKNVPVRVSMVNNAINGAHYFYTRGTDRWETTTVLIPDAEFNGNANDIQIRLVRDDDALAISKVELYDGNALSDGAKNVTGITSGLTVCDGLFNSSLATWQCDDYTSVEPVTVDSEQAFKLTSSRDNSRAELRIVPDYRYLGQTTAKVKYPAETEELPDGEVRPVKVRVTYYKGSGIMYVKGAKLKEDGTGAEWPVNDGVIKLSDGTGWVTAEYDIDDYYVNGGADVFKTYIQFITNGASDGTIIKSIEIVAK